MALGGMLHWLGRTDEQDDLFEKPLYPVWRTLTFHQLHFAYVGASHVPEIRSASERHFAAQTRTIMATPTKAFSELSTRDLDKIRAYYACCCHRQREFIQALRYQNDPVFRDELIALRTVVLREQAEHMRVRRAKEAYNSRRPECLATKIDLEGETAIDLSLQMSPDDWHEIAKTWHWDIGGMEPMRWIISQPNCDLGTATHILFQLDPVSYARQELLPDKKAWAVASLGLARDICCRIVEGCYSQAELLLPDGERGLKVIQWQYDALAALNGYPWTLPASILAVEGRRNHHPKYTTSNAVFYYHYDYWLREIAELAG